MRQVPTYGIIGDGRMARHFCHYLNLLEIPFLQWARKSAQDGMTISYLVEHCSPILLLIKDEVIESFIGEYPFLQQKKLIHFSGSLSTPLAFGTHPLMTFAQPLYDLNIYQRIPFILEEHSPDFKDLLPGLPNPHARIPVNLKPLYHAFCVMSNSFTTLLWQSFFKELDEKFQLPREMGMRYLQQTLNNLLEDPTNALTGPFVRKDKRTIQSHLKTLEEHPMKEIYLSFLKTFAPELEIS